MSFREITMQDVSEVLRRYQAGQSAWHIAHETGLDRKMVGPYLAEAKDKEVLPDTIVSEEVVRAVGMVVQSRPAQPPSKCWKILVQHHEQLRAWPTIRLDDPPPGLEAQIDFGLMGMVVDSEGKSADFMYCW